MKRVLTVLCFVFIWASGYSEVNAEPASNAPPLSFPNKFGVTGLYTLIGTDTFGDRTLSIGLSTDFSEFELPEDPRTPRLKEIGLHAGFSLNDKFEIGAEFPYRVLKISRESDIEGFKNSGMGDILATAKYRLLDEQDSLPALGMFSMLSFPTGDAEKGLGSGTTDFTIGGALTKHLGLVNLYGNIGFLLSGWNEGDPNPLFDNYQNSLLYGFGIEFPMMSDKIRIFSELTFVHEFGDDEDDQIMTFQGLEADDETTDDETTDDETTDDETTDDETTDDETTDDETTDDEIADDELEGAEEDQIIIPEFVAVTEDVVDDAGQIGIGVNIALAEGLFLTGGAAFKILGEELVPDAPKWRAFVNLSCVFGRRKAAKPAEVKPLATEVSNRCPEITGISVSDSTVSGGEHVRIAVTASDPDNDQPLYFWVASRGSLTGRESNVVWTAPECSGTDKTVKTYDLTVEVSDGECAVDRLIQLSVDCSLGQKSDGVILFPSGSTKLDNIAKAQLDNIAMLLKQFPDQNIIIIGHTDSAGKEELNQRIGLKRAESAKQYLVKRHGIDSNRITTTSYGSKQPIDTNDTKAGRARNRRVEIYRNF